jgi:hypothetical protein
LFVNILCIDLKKYFYFRFDLISIAKLRTFLLINEFNLTATVDALCKDTSHVYLKSKRKSFFQNDYKTTENIEFLKEVKILFN